MSKPKYEPLAPGEALGINIRVEKADGQKCPRCWKYHTVRGNPQELCDGCISAILEGLPYWVEKGVFTQEQADEFRAECKAMANRWKATS
jgi:hypothetical protein